MSGEPTVFEQQVAFVQAATRRPESAKAVRDLFEAVLPDALREFYGKLAKIDNLSGYFSEPGTADRLGKAQARHWEKVFADSLPVDLADHSSAVGQAHADIGLSSGWYMSAYAWLLVRMVGPLVRKYQFRPGKLEAVLTTLIQRSFFDMICSTAAYENGISKYQQDNVTKEGNIRDLKNLSSTVNDVNELALELAYLSRNTRNVNVSTQTIASAVAEMVASVDAIARSSEGAVVDAGHTDATVETGRAAVDKVNSAIRNIAEAVDETARSVDELGKASVQITQILNVIEGIASQTNLLALNATIEAARAGEAGRGFAVVAAEVKGLANQTSRATDDINARIVSLRDGMNLITQTMARSKSAVVEGQTAIGEASQTMDSIAEQVGNVSFKMKDISSILGQQTAATTEVGRNVERVATIAAENATLLNKMSGKLHDSNDRFSQSAKSWFEASSHRALCEMAKIDHVLFKKRVVDVLMGRGEWTASEVPDHHGCRLGKWYDSIQIPAIRSHPAFRALVEPHKRVHAAARAVLQAHAAEDADEALKFLTEMNEASHGVLVHLAELSDALSSEVGGLDRRSQGRRATLGEVKVQIDGQTRRTEVRDISSDGARLSGIAKADVGKEGGIVQDDGCCASPAAWSSGSEGGLRFTTRAPSSTVRKFVAD